MSEEVNQRPARSDDNLQTVASLARMTSNNNNNNNNNKMTKEEALERLRYLLKSEHDKAHNEVIAKDIVRLLSEYPEDLSKEIVKIWLCRYSAFDKFSEDFIQEILETMSVSAYKIQPTHQYEQHWSLRVLSRIQHRNDSNRIRSDPMARNNLVATIVNKLIAASRDTDASFNHESLQFRSCSIDLNLAQRMVILDRHIPFLRQHNYYLGGNRFITKDAWLVMLQHLTMNDRSTLEKQRFNLLFHSELFSTGTGWFYFRHHFPVATIGIRSGFRNKPKVPDISFRFPQELFGAGDEKAIASMNNLLDQLRIITSWTFLEGKDEDMRILSRLAFPPTITHVRLQNFRLANSEAFNRFFFRFGRGIVRNNDTTIKDFVELLERHSLKLDTRLDVTFTSPVPIEACDSASMIDRHNVLYGLLRERPALWSTAALAEKK